MLTSETISHLAKLEIKPLRIAFDHADEENIGIYIKAQWLAAEYGFKYLSNYILFNFNDTLKDLYTRLRINIDLNKDFAKHKLKTNIWSFPMKYMPFKGKNRFNRKYIGKFWNAKMLRGVQCILNATHGVVGPKEGFFCHAFGNNYEEFEELIYMPELYITKRVYNAEYANEWRLVYRSLNNHEKQMFLDLIKNNTFPKKNIENNKISFLYQCYLKKKL